MTNENDIRKLRQGNFVVNNGIVMRAVNLLRMHFNKLSGVQKLLFQRDGIIEADFLDSLNFLVRAGYIELREISSKRPVILADCDYRTLEAIITEKGIRLAAGSIHDDLVEVCLL
ncbi:MAG: type VI secretion protein [Oscillospiraceae bacterium]|jgi:hypothetical protein|nr:type VI secretion protein [Oscillospiraceae bacterium]